VHYTKQWAVADDAMMIILQVPLSHSLHCCTTSNVFRLLVARLFIYFSHTRKSLRKSKLVTLYGDAEPELDMDWIHPRIGLDWIGLSGITATPFLISNHCSTVDAVSFKL